MIWRSAMRTRDKMASHLTLELINVARHLAARKNGLRASAKLAVPWSQRGLNILPPRSQVAAFLTSSIAVTSARLRSFSDSRDWSASACQRWITPVTNMPSLRRNARVQQTHQLGRRDWSH